MRKGFSEKRMQRIRKGLALFLTGLLLWFMTALSEEEIFLPLTVESRSEQVLEAKRRLQELGYIASGSLTKTFTEKTAESVALFQKVNGLEETGIIDAGTWEALFSF